MWTCQRTDSQGSHALVWLNYWLCSLTLRKIYITAIMFSSSCWNSSETDGRLKAAAMNYTFKLGPIDYKTEFISWIINAKRNRLFANSLAILTSLLNFDFICIKNLRQPQQEWPHKGFQFKGRSRYAHCLSTLSFIIRLHVKVLFLYFNTFLYSFFFYLTRYLGSLERTAQ